MNDSLPTDLKGLFKLNEIVHGKQTRQLFHVPSVDTSTYGINSIKYHGLVLWNTIWKNTMSLIMIAKQMSYTNRIDYVIPIFKSVPYQTNSSFAYLLIFG